MSPTFMLITYDILIQRINLVEKAFDETNRSWKFYKWKMEHPILRKIPFIVNYKRKKIWGK